MTPAAVILPPAEQLRPAMLEASRAERDPSCKLYTDGHRLAWLPRRLPGWYRIGAAIKQARPVRLWDEPAAA